MEKMYRTSVFHSILGQLNSLPKKIQDEFDKESPLINSSFNNSEIYVAWWTNDENESKCNGDKSNGTELSEEKIKKNIKSPSLWLFAVLSANLVTCIALSLSDNKYGYITDNPWFGTSKITLLSIGAFHKYFVEKGELWRFLTFPFVSPGIINSLVFGACLMILTKLEGRMGFLVTLVAFMLSSFVGCMISTIFSPTSIICGPMYGISGLLGIWVYRKSILKNTNNIIEIIIIGVFLLLSAFLPFSDIYGTVASFAFGIMFGITAVSPYSKNSGQKRLTRAILSGLFFIIMCLTIWAIIWLYSQNSNICPNCGNVSCLNVLSWCNTSILI